MDTRAQPFDNVDVLIIRLCFWIGILNTALVQHPKWMILLKT